VKHIAKKKKMNNTDTKLVRGNLVDIISREIYGAVVTISNGKISKIERTGIRRIELYFTWIY
jgi:Adenine deaminase (EC 3.5.4.2)